MNMKMLGRYTSLIYCSQTVARPVLVDAVYRNRWLIFWSLGPVEKLKVAQLFVTSIFQRF
jgi:hypothetical protein